MRGQPELMINGREVISEIERLRSNYQSSTATDFGRRQMLDHLQTFVLQLEEKSRDETSGDAA